MREESLVGLHIAMYVRKGMQPHIKDVQASRLKFGMGGLGNKGACAIRLTYKKSSMSFAVAHLESGEDEKISIQRR